MKTKKYNWKYVLMGIFCMGFAACTHDSADEPNPVVKDEISRSTITVERTVTLTTPGTLQEQLEAAMAGEDVATLQKLTLVGPYNGWDVEYWKTTLTNLIEFDLKDAVPTYTEDVTVYDEWGNDCRQHDNEIMVNSFYEMSSLEKIVFPSSITCIKRFACKGCTNLTEVIFPANLNTIEEYVFDNCGFTSIEIPSSVTRLGYGAFRDNLKLKSVKILADITHIESSTFFNCTELETVEFSPSIEEIYDSALEGCTSLKSFPFSQITKINQWSFANSGIEEANLSNVTDFSNAYYAFYACKSLKKVILPETITSLANSMFCNCILLTDINLPNSLETINDGLFENCAFKEIIIPSSVKHIGNSAFAFNTSLKSVVLHDGIESLGNNCFEYCDSLSSVTLPSQLKVLPNSVFWSCDSLKSITLPSTLEKIGNAAFGDSGLESIVIPASVNTIEAQAFRNTKLKSLHIPATVTNVTSRIIDWCQHIKYIKWESSAIFDDVENFNYNCNLYINDGVTTGPNWINANVFIKKGDGKYHTEKFTLSVDAQRENKDLAYYIPEDFIADKVVYERYFDNWTYPGTSSGWQTIVLPFSPTMIEHETKGKVAPFNSGIEGAKPFWLRELTAEGWKDKPMIEANKPYIIAMPNHESYMDEYRLYGKIIFSANNIEFTKEKSAIAPSVSSGPYYDFQPTYQYVEHGSSVYALNVNYGISGYEYGSVFAKNSSSVYAFEAYVTTGSRLARSTFGIDTSSDNTRSAKEKNTTGIPQIGDM